MCCGAGAGAGGAEIIWDLEPEPEPKINNFGSATLDYLLFAYVSSL